MELQALLNKSEIIKQNLEDQNAKRKSLLVSKIVPARQEIFVGGEVLYYYVNYLVLPLLTCYSEWNGLLVYK